ncbi:MAG: methyltransferase domain-containing protein [Elusimicrobia bacterium]|nr:methyltransferase domain-containing protein [Elusimicrobiota bacterium]
MTLPRLSMLPTFLREWLGKRRFPREPEPDLVMDEKDQVEAYRVAGRIDGVMAAHYLYQTSRISQVVQGRGTVLDLGCGPATQLVQIAELNPATRFIGVDLSDEMLKEARDHAAARGLSNVEFRKQDMTRLVAFPDHSVDGVISTLAFHHLPTQAHLEKTLREVTRVLRPDGALYLIDFGRLKSLRSVLFFSYMNADHQPHLFSRDYERSLRAAFTREEFEALAARCLPPSARLLTTFRIPFLVVLKTEDRPLPAPTAERLRSLAEALSPRYKNDLEEMRLFFGLGGFGPDPFSSTPPVAVAAKQWMALFHDAPFRRRLPVSTLARGARALRLFVRAAYWRRRVERARRAEETARRRHRESEAQALERFGDVLTGELGRLKGPLMKFGQMLSYVGESLPAPVREKLKNLQDHAAPIAPGRIRQIIEAELGRPLRDAFLEFVDAPIAAASISQLHLARRRDGRWVVVKVKYPGIAEAVRSDISLLRFVAPFLKGLLNIGNAKEVLEELQRLILAECDFSREADHQDTFARVFADDPEIVIPAVHRDLSTSGLLTMDYVQGERFAAFAARADRAAKNRAATVITRMAVTSIHRHCAFNADPHPGNYLFLPGGRVCFLDFGFTKRWSREFINLSKTQSLAALNGDLETFGRTCRALGYTSDNPAFNYTELLTLLREGTYGTWLEDKPFVFSRDFVRRELAAMGDFARRCGPFRFSPDHIPLHRVYWGHHSLFADLEAEVNIHRELVPLLKIPV